MTIPWGPAVGACPRSMHEGVDAMGRGRQKAKQTKVARELKYYSPETDYDSLQRELAGGSGHSSGPAVPTEDPVERDDVGDEYADWSSDNRY